MNRIILIGNGFDQAHDLKTSYANFIDWYWDMRMKNLQVNDTKKSSDNLCTLELLSNDSLNWRNFYNQNQLQALQGRKIIKRMETDKQNFKVVYKSDFFSTILKSYQIKGWVDIENEYYRLLFPSVGNGPSFYINKPNKLNEEFESIRSLLMKYLNKVQESNINEYIIKQSIKDKLFTPINKREKAVSSVELWENMLDQRLQYSETTWNKLFMDYGVQFPDSMNVTNYILKFPDRIKEYAMNNLDEDDDKIPKEFFLPDRVLLLTFNYTTTADLYLPGAKRFSINHIHGRLENQNSVIFGYGDEMDENYKKMSEKNDNEYLQNIKSIKYLETPNYRDLLAFIESDAYQIYIMGHSCGNSDRTLLNTLFEHKNCISIKPFYYMKDGTDNYMELVQNISRNFTDKKLMRDRVVNKSFCETL